MKLILRVVINALALGAAAWLVPGIRAGSVTSLLLIALVFGILNALVRMPKTSAMRSSDVTLPARIPGNEPGRGPQGESVDDKAQDRFRRGLLRRERYPATPSRGAPGTTRTLVAPRCSTLRDEVSPMDRKDHQSGYQDNAPSTPRSPAGPFTIDRRASEGAPRGRSAGGPSVEVFRCRLRREDIRRWRQRPPA